MDERTGVITAAIADLKSVTEENRRTLRGHNGDAGLLERVRLVEVIMTRLVDEALPEMEKRIMTELTKSQERNVRWPWLLEKFLVPVITAAITAGALWLIYGGHFAP
jgi:hypothetical protein